jgi:hypothetical protein
MKAAQRSPWKARNPLDRSNKRIANFTYKHQNNKKMLNFYLFKKKKKIKRKLKKIRNGNLIMFFSSEFFHVSE